MKVLFLKETDDKNMRNISYMMNFPLINNNDTSIKHCKGYSYQIVAIQQRLFQPNCIIIRVSGPDKYCEVSIYWLKSRLIQEIPFLYFSILEFQPFFHLNLKRFQVRYFQFTFLKFPLKFIHFHLKFLCRSL